MTMEFQPRLSQAMVACIGAGKLTYDKSMNMYVDESYISQRMNEYHRGFYISNNLIIEICLGRGSGYTTYMLNDVRVYTFNGTRKELIGSKSWGGCFNYCFFSEWEVACTSCRILKDYLHAQLKLQGSIIRESELDRTVLTIINTTMSNQYMLNH